MKEYFDTEYITSSILNIKNEVCPYADCKCHKENTATRRNKNENKERITVINSARTDNILLSICQYILNGVKN